MSETMDNNGSDDDYEDTVDTPTHETKSGSDDEVIAVLSEEELNELRDKSLALKSEANDRFRDELYDESIELYTKALDTCPPEFGADRAVVHSNRSAAHLHCHRLDEALNDCNEAILLDDHYVKAILRRAQIYRQMGNKLDESLKDYERVLELDTSCAEAKTASNELRHEINERNERLKTEMMSKLKDLGNLVLRPFGLSTDNFKMSQNGETGGYSVNFQNN
ncbi:unnamed protein product [Medioppia subpectinata]|uniref:Tetratricopeptide repeat protein 1 n=1 Tax=Medioppia subpectinata TaxID=1979941 RepID=A0A7R9QGX0_9ACAR|nr:unnamed protein product [Medioppia subpectinata]CAG2119805.1 unnamed protein product [Medioppia subpectinata]